MVPPVLSRVIPIMAPRIIRKPIEPIVLPNPSLMVFIIVSAGSVVKARKRDTIKRAINACSLSRDVRIIIARMLIMTRMEIARVLISISKVNFAY